MNPRARAFYMDTALREGIIRRAWEGESVRENWEESVISFVFCGLLSLVLSGGLTGLAGMPVASVGLAAVDMAKGFPFEGRKWSLFIGLPFDRLLLTKAALSIGRLIKAAK